MVVNAQSAMRTEPRSHLAHPNRILSVFHNFVRHITTFFDIRTHTYHEGCSHKPCRPGIGQERRPTPVKPFDYDVLIQITPETYHALKNKIGEEILEVMRNTFTSDTSS